MILRFDFILYPDTLYFFQDNILLYKILSRNKNKKHYLPSQMANGIENHFIDKKTNKNIITRLFH